MSVDLRVDWCSYQAAKYAVEHWHYSRTMPSGKIAKFGVWENGQYIGCVLFSLGTNKAINDNYRLSGMQACELTRVALKKHETPVSSIVSICVKMLKSQSLGLRLIVSYADPLHGHNGAIYQAMNWLYAGNENRDSRNRSYRNAKSNRVITWRSMAALLVRSPFSCNVEGAVKLGWEPLELINKHKYLYPLDRAMRKQIEPLRKPYPKRETCGPSVEGDTPSQTESSVRSAGAALNSDLL